MSRNISLRAALCASLLLVGLASSFAFAQVNQAANSQSTALTITAFASTERVRFTAPASIVQMRLEVYDAAGRKLFDNELRGGNVLDWHLQDGQAARLPSDTYLCVVTVKSRAGRITQRLGAVLVEVSSASVQAVTAAQLTAQQAAAIGPVEEQASVSVVQDGEAQPGTVLAHTGEEAQLVRGRGALSFRLGDFLAGKDREQMRLTAEGKLGLGVTDPQAKLDVAGPIRTSEGIVFPDGTIQTTAYVASGRSLSSLSERSSLQRDGAGRSVTEAADPTQKNSAGRLGPPVKTTNIPDDLVVNGNFIFTPPSVGFTRDITMQNNNFGLRFFGAPSLTNSPAAAAIQFWGNGNQFFPGQLYLDSGAHNSAALIFRTAGTGGTITERMRVTATGNVGIGATNPVLLSGGSGRILSISDQFNPGLALTNTGTGGHQFFLYSFTNGQADGSNFRIYDATKGKDRFFIDQRGLVGIGLDNPGALLDVAATLTEDDITTLVSASFRGTVRAGNILPQVNNSYSLGLSGNFWTAVYATNGTIQTSDARLKQSINNLKYGLREVMQLRPVSFEWKDKADGKLNLGLLAQEVEPLIPEVVVREANSATPLGMNYTSLVPVVIKAIQEQQATLDQKDAAIKALQQRNAEHDARLIAVEQALQQLLSQQRQAQSTKRQ